MVSRGRWRCRTALLRHGAVHLRLLWVYAECAHITLYLVL